VAEQKKSQKCCLYKFVQILLEKLLKTLPTAAKILKKIQDLKTI